ncbi:MAG: type IV secretion protein IcmD [Coxiellaceae bacterium]|nr:type IV secretion protein IcmD [Coxiellaceae bacterium]
MMKIKRSTMKSIAKVAAIALGVVVAEAFATGTGKPLYLSAIQTNLTSTVSSLGRVFTIVSLIAGIGFVMASFFKFHQHKLNPTQVPVSQGVTLLLIGAGLMAFPLLLPTATHAAFGVSQSGISQVSGGAINSIIGS